MKDQGEFKEAGEFCVDTDRALQLIDEDVVKLKVLRNLGLHGAAEKLELRIAQKEELLKLMDTEYKVLDLLVEAGATVVPENKFRDYRWAWKAPEFFIQRSWGPEITLIGFIFVAISLLMFVFGVAGLATNNFLDVLKIFAVVYSIWSLAYLGLGVQKKKSTVTINPDWSVKVLEKIAQAQKILDETPDIISWRNEKRGIVFQRLTHIKKVAIITRW